MFNRALIILTVIFLCLSIAVLSVKPLKQQAFIVGDTIGLVGIVYSLNILQCPKGIVYKDDSVVLPKDLISKEDRYISNSIETHCKEKTNYIHM